MTEGAHSVSGFLTGVLLYAAGYLHGKLWRRK